jgi:hypothetical protein
MGKKNERKRILMTKYDRLQALVRIPQYLKDSQEVKDVFNLNRRKEFFKKYGLDAVIVDSNFVEKYTKEDIEETTIFPADFIATVIPADKNQFDFRLWLREGRYLTIKIDLMENKKAITAKVKSLTDFFSKYVEKPKTRQKETVYSPWDVHDLHHKENLNFSQIAKKLSDSKGHPSRDRYLMAEYKKVKRAYDKACKMIRQVKKDIKSIPAPS